MARGSTAVVIAVAGALALASPASAASKNVELVGNVPEAKNATAINFLNYGSMGRGKGAGNAQGSHDVMLVTGRFGLKSYSLANPAKPRFLDEITAEELRLPGDPAVRYAADGTPISTFWQNEDMDVDRDRKLAIMSRDPRAYAGSTSREPGEPDPNGATNIAGFYVVDAKNPRDLKLLTFQQLPTGHTTTCINGCQWTWSGGPASTTRQREQLGWTFGRPIIVTDLTDPANPKAYPQNPVDLFRRDGATAYAHDVQVDAAGVAWVSGDGGTRGYWTDGVHFDPLQNTQRLATPLDPIPYGGGGLPRSVTADDTGGFEHNAWRPVGDTAPSDPRYRRGEMLLVSEEDFNPASNQCRDRSMFTIASLEGSYDGDAWRSTPENPYRLQVVGKWNPFEKEGSRPTSGPYNPLADFCSAHYFDVDGPLVTMAWYGEGTRFLDISDPANPTQVAYWRPEDGVVWASYLHNGYVYTADRTRGVDVLKLKLPARASATGKRRAVSAPRMKKRQVRFLKRLARSYAPDPATGGLCLLPRY
ncbi:MAG TPA: hypothetical protein VM266_13580 [Solirubrobacteraceae bacterium]|nr:hypothetical protein [Solirubrobacteraceae bacterium]